MQRYGSTRGYGGRRRRTHRLRNSFILLLALLVGGAIFAGTPAGASFLSRLGVPSLRDVPPIASNNPVPAATDEPSGAGKPTRAPTVARPADPTAPAGAAQRPTQAPIGATSAPAPTAVVMPTPPPSASPLQVAQAYLGNWQAGRYEQMIQLVSKASLQENGYTARTLAERYANIRDVTTIQAVEPKLAPEATQAAQGQELLLRLPYSVKITTALVGDITESGLLPLVKEGNDWRVQWSPSLIFKDLTGKNRIRPAEYPASRGAIFDRNGKPLAIDGEIMQVGVVPGNIKNERQLLDTLSRALGMDKNTIRAAYQGREPTYFWPIRDLLQERVEPIRRQVGDVQGVDFQPRRGRTYPQRTVLAQTLGYVKQATADDLKNPKYKSYTASDVVPHGGLEEWGEPYLRGVKGGKLYIVDEQGVEVATIKERLAQPGHNLYLNVDLDLQIRAEQYLGGTRFPGSVVAIDPNNGEILALASQPSFDNNKFVVGFSAEEYNRLISEQGNNPFQNRPTGSSYPMASTFKVITTSAAIELGIPEISTRTWFSDGTWERLGESQVRRDWKPGGHGNVRLIDGLTESVDYIYYDLGYELYQKCLDCLSKHAMQWKLGAPLGVDGILSEAAGLVPRRGAPTPYWGPGENVNLSIGQGALRASPLQVAFVYATIGNGGTMYKPLLINRIVSAEDSSKVIKEWKPTPLGKAPAKPETIQFLQQGLRTVTTAEKGTARKAFLGSPISSAGKTGTGEQDQKDPFAWYAGYAPAVSPKVSVVALLENAGQGSQLSAPIVRRVMEDYLQPPAARP